MCAAPSGLFRQKTPVPIFARRETDPHNITQRLLDSGTAGMWERAAARLLDKLKRDPEDRVLLESLGQIYRQQGDLAAAAAIYEKLCALDPTDVLSRHVHAVLSGSPLPLGEKVTGPWPAPFVLIRGLLSTAERNHVMSLVRQQWDDLAPLRIYDPENGRNIYRPERRQQLGARAGDEIQSIMRAKLAGVLPGSLPHLQLDVVPFDVHRIRITLSQDGHFSKTHTDDIGMSWKVSVLYYLQHQPKRFRGGDLLLFDTHFDAETGQQGYCPAQFTRVIHEDNSLVAFPCNYFHQVTKVTCESGRLEDGRIAISSFVERAAA